MLLGVGNAVTELTRVAPTSIADISLAMLEARGGGSLRVSLEVSNEVPELTREAPTSGTDISPEDPDVLGD